MGKRVYVASRWNNPLHGQFITLLKEAGHVALDFRDTGVKDDDLFGARQGREWIEHMTSSRAAEHAYTQVVNQVARADVVVLVQPAGASAHWELGCAFGMRKPTAVLMGQGPLFKPELMYKSATLLTTDVAEMMEWLKTL